MKCLGRTKAARCKNDTTFLFCRHHRWQPITFIFSIVVVISVFGGVYQDIIKPLLIDSNKNTDNIVSAKINSIEIPIRIESTWEEYSDLDRKAEFYIVRSETPLMQTVVYSGSAKVKIPKNGLTVNEMISIAPYKTTKTTVILPRVEILNKYLDEGGYEIQIILFNKYGRVFTHMQQKLFDKEILSRGITYWFRLMPKQMP